MFNRLVNRVGDRRVKNTEYEQFSTTPRMYDMDTAMLTSKDIAEYFLAQTDEDIGDFLTNHKVQKLVYWAQGHHLALFDAPLFDKEIEAWVTGPTVPALFREYKAKHGNGPIAMPTDFDFDKFSPGIKEFLDDVYNVYGQYAPWKLRQMTLHEPPYYSAYKVMGGDCVISREAMRDYFKMIDGKNDD